MRYAIDAETIHETKKAILVRVETSHFCNDETWLPKSQVATVDMGTLWGEAYRGQTRLTVPAWLFRKLPRRMQDNAHPVA